MLYLQLNSMTLLKKIGPELDGIGLVIQILDFFFIFKPNSSNLKIIELKKTFIFLWEKLLKLDPKAI